MNIYTLIVLIALTLSVVGGERSEFQVVGEPGVGKSVAFKVSKSIRAIIKADKESYLLLELLESSYDSDKETSMESCRISWTLISPASVQTDTESAFIRYKRTKNIDGSFTVEATGGSEKIEIGGLSMRWSYQSSSSIFLYADPGTQYAIAGGE